MSFLGGLFLIIIYKFRYRIFYHVQPLMNILFSLIISLRMIEEETKDLARLDFGLVIKKRIYLYLTKFLLTLFLGDVYNLLDFWFC